MFGNRSAPVPLELFSILFGVPDKPESDGKEVCARTIALFFGRLPSILVVLGFVFTDRAPTVVAKRETWDPGYPEQLLERDPTCSSVDKGDIQFLLAADNQSARMCVT